MNVKYKGIGRKSVAGLLLCLMGVLTACEDDFGKNGTNSGVLTMKVEVPEGWTSGVAVDEEAPDSRCVSVKELSCDGGTKLYLHTIVADNPVEETVSATRGTPIKDLTEFKKKYTRFSLSGICYNGEYPSDESKNEWTTEYAHDLYFSTETGTQQIGEGRPSLVWPYNDKVKFFAFVPTMEDFEAMKTEGSLKMSSSGVTGSPTLTYTVPTDVEKQIDLMTASADYNFSSTSTQVPLKFGHALTAVRIACGEGMFAGTISKVEISGIYGSGKQVIGSNKWEPSGAPVSYTISKVIELPTDDKSGDQVHAGKDTPITGTDKDNLTFILMPQTLPKDASITIEFTDAATGTKRTITGSIAGHKWEAGTIITYSISPLSINIKASVEFNKQGATAENPTGDVMPYSGVWYDATYKAKAEIVQAGVDAKEIEEISNENISFQYKLEGSEKWDNCITDASGLLQIAPQPAYKTMRDKFKTATETKVSSETSPFSLSDEYGEPANCYLIDQAGYYSLSLVYGNGCTKPTSSSINSFTYYPKHDEGVMPADGKISGAHDAVLCWQDAPDLIDPTSVKVVDKDKLVFRIRKQTLAQGNALLAVRDQDKNILWSWHIWVTPYKKDFYTATANTLAKYNLGWCDRHKDNNDERKFALQAVIDMSVYGGTTEKVELGEFTQMEFKGSEAGDNTYYQWGRKDPMLGGIYNSTTPKYKFEKKGNKNDINTDEFNMENKQVFNQYNQDGYNYSFCKNPGDMVELDDEASDGVTIGYTIKHPYMFITNSRSAPSDGNTGYPHYEPKFQFRNNWHLPNNDSRVTYLREGKKFCNAWDANATDVSNDDANVKKTVYDPCPPKFKVPNVNAFNTITFNSFNSQNHAWDVTINGKACEVPITGMRDYALRRSEWTTVKVSSGTVPGFSYDSFYRISMPAFYDHSFVSSATLGSKKDTDDGYEVGDHVKILDVGTEKYYYTISSNSYGLPVRPMKEPD